MNDVDAIESLMNKYPNALLETNNVGIIPMDRAIKNGLEAMKLSCSNKFLNYGTLLEDQALYNNSINPINLIFIEANYGKRSADDVVEFIKQLQRKPTIFRALVYHAMKSDTDSSPGSNARKIKCNEEILEFILNALKEADVNKEILASHNASVGFDDAPRGPDRLGRRPLAKAVVKVLKTIEGPATHIACSLYGAWGSGKTQFVQFLREEMKNHPQDTTRIPESFILVCNFVCRLVEVCNFVSCLMIEENPLEIPDGRPETVVSENKCLCFLFCCGSFLMLPMYALFSYVCQLFRSGKINFDEKGGGIDPAKLKKMERPLSLDHF